MLRAQVGRRRERVRRHAGVGHRRGQRHRAGDRAGIRPRWAPKLVVSDIDEAARPGHRRKDRRAQGGVAHAYRARRVRRRSGRAFADEVCAEHGVPDIVVNNAGIGQAGAVPGHPGRAVGPGARHQPRRRGQRLPGVRAPARRAWHRRAHRQRRVDGRVRAAAVAERLLHRKAAVYMFSDCLRAELDAAGIGLTTVCPGVDRTPTSCSTTRFDAPPAQAAWQRRAARRQCGEDVRQHGATARTRWPRRSCRRCRRTSRSGRWRRRPTCCTAPRGWRRRRCAARLAAR